MREWLGLLAAADVDPLREADRLRRRGALGRWADIPRRALNTWAARRGTNDFSLEVKEAMDGCLACKSCVGQCPIKVDVPAFRSRFLEIHHGRYLRPVKDHLVALLERALPLAARTPQLFNGLTRSAVGRAALRRLGLVCLPALSGLDLKTHGVRMASVAALSRLSDRERAKSIVIVQDAFTSYYDTRVVLDFHALLKRLGFEPWLAPFMPNGKPQHVLGFLRKFERTAAANARSLNALAATGVALVGVDPSMTLTYRAEYAKSLDKEVLPKVALPQEWLATRLADLPELASDATGPWFLLPHCTERTNAPSATNDWVKVARRFGMDLRVLRAGCCGMAGLYGHEAANRHNSEAIYQLSWSKLVFDPRHEGRLAATGYSCRCQAKLIDGATLRHPLQMLLARMKAAEAQTASAKVAPEAAALSVTTRAEYHEEH